MLHKPVLGSNTFTDKGLETLEIGAKFSKTYDEQRLN